MEIGCSGHRTQEQTVSSITCELSRDQQIQVAKPFRPNRLPCGDDTILETQLRLAFSGGNIPEQDPSSLQILHDLRSWTILFSNQIPGHSLQ